MSSDRPLSYHIKDTEPGALLRPLHPTMTGMLSPPPEAPPPSGSMVRGEAKSLVQAIRDEFVEIAGKDREEPTFADCDEIDVDVLMAAGDRRISTEDVARYWERLAVAELYAHGRSLASLGGRGKQAIALRVAQLMQDMDLMKVGKIGIDEWVHYMLMARSGFAARQVNVLLDKALQRNKSILHELQKMFDAADTTKSGALNFSEIVAMYSQKLWHLRPSCRGPARQMTDEELREGSPEEFAREVIQAMDISGDERVSYAEFMAYSLGRRKHEVVLHLYDLSNGAAKQVSPWLIGKELEGVWHTGVVVYGKEYYYSKDTVYADAGDTSFGKPTRIVPMGYTLWRQDELHEFVTSELKPVFQRDTYDVVCNNCNHFSDRVSMFLVNKHPPPEVMQQPDMLLRAKSVRVLRPILNWWLRDRIVVRETGVALPPGAQRLKPGDQPSLGTIVTVHAAVSGGPSVLGQVTIAPDRLDSESGIGPSIGLHPTATTADNGVPWGLGCAVLASPTDSCAPTGAGCDQAGCGGLWSGTCGAIKASASQALGGGSSPSGVWVQYFDAALGGSTFVGRAQVKVELLPHSRLSIGGLREGDGEDMFRRALRAIDDQQQPSSHRGGVPQNDMSFARSTARGTVPHRVPTPNCMSLADGETRPRQSPGFSVAGISQL